jgi:peptidyl-prolyl cis-trans isomerase D
MPFSHNYEESSMAKIEEPKHVSQKHIARSQKEMAQKKILIIGTIIVAALALSVILYGVLDQVVFLNNKAVVTVNNQKISLNDFKEMAMYSRYQMKEQYNYNYYIFQVLGEDPSVAQSFASNMIQVINDLKPENAIAFGQQIVTSLTDNAILDQQAKVMGITVSEDEINKKIEEIFAYNVENAPTATPFPTLIPTQPMSKEQLALVTATPIPTLEPTLAEQPATPTAEATVAVEPTSVGTPTEVSTPAPTPTAYTLEGFKTEYSKYMTTLGEYKISEKFFRNLVRLEILKTKVQAEVTKDITPVQDHVWARHILVADKTVADVLYQRLTAGKEDFATLAAEASIDTGNNTTGGDLGWFPRNTMVKEFETAVFDNLAVGEISQPIETKFGYHIIQKLGEEKRSVSESQYTSILTTAYNYWLTGIKDTSTIKTNDIWMQNVPTDIVISQEEIPASIAQLMN